ncbi:MAG: TonB-dependent receptor [Rhodothermales bacterium]
MRCRLLLLGLIGWLPAVAWSQQADTVRVALPEVTVTALGSLAASLPSRLTVLGPDALRATDAASAADVLDARAPLFIRRYGATGAATVSLRGATSAQALVVLDGHRLADPQSGQIDLTLVPSLVLAGADVLHGTASARYGSGAIGGVVRLRTVAPAGSLHVRTQLRGEAFGGRGGGLLASGEAGTVGWLIAGEASTADGDFSYPNRALLNAPPVTRTGADRTMATLYARLDLAGQHRFTLWHSDTDRGIPGPGNAPPVGARQGDRQKRLMWQTQQATAQQVLALSAQAQVTALHYQNPARATDETTHTQQVTANAVLDRQLTPSLPLQLGAELGWAQVSTSAVHQFNAATFVSSTLSLGPVRLFPSLRADAFAVDGTTTLALSPHLAATLPLRSNWVLKTSSGYGFRYPTLGERFWQPGSNPNLLPERAWNADLGLAMQQAVGRFTVDAEVTGYASRVANQVVWFPSFVDAGVQLWRPTNLSRATRGGIEVSGRIRYTGVLGAELGGVYTHTRSDDRSNPNAASYRQQVRYVPIDLLKLYGSLGLGRVRLDAHARLVGPRFTAADGSQSLPAYQVIDLHLSTNHRLGALSLNAGLVVENALDATYEILSFYPMPPRHLRARLTVTY